MNASGAMKSVLLLSLVAAVSSVSFADLKNDKIERGRYLVEEVGMCGDCHTPPDIQGEPDRSRWLQGAQVWFQPIQSVPNWAYAAPSIAGLGSFTKEQALQVLEKGLGPQGNPVRRPMHRYHMATEDAEAVVAYLQSLPAVSH